MDLIADYPEENVAFIGFFMTNVNCQNQGIGSDIIESTLHYLKMKGYVRVRLGVDRGNPQSYSFWLKNGFVKICESNYIIMERLL